LYQILNLPNVKDTPPFEWKLPSISGGVNYEDLPWNCSDNQSPSTVNVWFANRILNKRMGTKNLNAAIGTPILSSYPFKFMGKFVFTSGIKMFALDTSTNIATQIYTGLTANKGCFLKFGGFLYYINGVQYVKYDGTTVTAVVPYVPTVIINRTPTGGGTQNEDYNRIGSGIKNSFNGDNSSTAYTLTDINLDATAITASFDSGLTFNKVETTNFTVNRTTGVVTFGGGSVPPTGTNNIIIQFYKTNVTVGGTISTILTCTQITAFGGANDSRIFFGANGTQYYYWTDVTKPEFVPMSQYNLIGTSDDAVTGFGLQDAVLCIFKMRSIYGATYSYDTVVGKASFPVVNVNSAIGCDCPETIRLINSRLVWCNTYGGVYTLVTNNITLNKEIKPISRNINGNSRAGGLLQEVNLQNAIAVEFGRGYWLTVNNHVYYWDYGLTPYQNASDYETAQKVLSWWYFKDLPVSCYMQDGNNLYFGDNVSGYIVHFENSFADNTNGIDASWKMADRNFGFPEMRKTVIEEWISARSDTASDIAIKHYSDRSPYGDFDSKPIIINPSFSWSTVTWSNICWGIQAAIQSFYRRVRKKNIKYYAVEFSNSTAGQDMNISDLRMNVSLDVIDRKG
jgi:hypothetical protein